MNYFSAYIYFIIFIKILFIIMAICHLYYKSKGEENSDINKKVVYWKERLEFIFVILMALLLIYVFNPRFSHVNLLTKEIQILLYLFGFILVITADWNVFFHESKWFKNLQKIIGKQE